MTFREKKSNKSYSFLLMLLVFIVVASVGYLYLSPAFEQNKPVVTLQGNGYWNLKSKLSIDIEDQSGIKYYKVVFKDNQRQIELAQEVLSKPEKNIHLELDSPKLDMFYKGENVSIEVVAIDNSKWNFLEGNSIVTNFSLNIDTQKPLVSILSNSRYIQRGGSAVLVTKIEESNVKEAYVSFNDEKRFELQPFMQKDYFVSLIAWPMDIEDFKRVNVVVKDKADNITITKVPYYIQEKRIKKDKITLTESFIKNISASVLEQSLEPIPQNTEEIFVYSNKVLRAKNLEVIEKTGKKNLDKMVEDFKIESFKRLRGSKTISGFGELREYFLDGQKINEAWHLGIDWASVRKAPVKVSNAGEVIFKNYLGLYGNTVIVDHGMGLCSLYAHTSTQDVNEGEMVKENQKIANTGATGAVFGDHLHFGILVQGIEVNPIEWMDKNWIKVRITDVLDDAKKQISRK